MKSVRGGWKNCAGGGRLEKNWFNERLAFKVNRFRRIASSPRWSVTSFRNDTVSLAEVLFRNCQGVIFFLKFSIILKKYFYDEPTNAGW